MIPTSHTFFYASTLLFTFQQIDLGASIYVDSPFEELWTCWVASVGNQWGVGGAGKREREADRAVRGLGDLTRNNLYSIFALCKRFFETWYDMNKHPNWTSKVTFDFKKYGIWTLFTQIGEDTARKDMGIAARWSGLHGTDGLRWKLLGWAGTRLLALSSLPADLYWQIFTCFSLLLLAGPRKKRPGLLAFLLWVFYWLASRYLQAAGPWNSSWSKKRAG